MNETLIGCIKQTESDNRKREMQDLIAKILESNQDINMTSPYAREYLAKQITKLVKESIDNILIEEHELNIKDRNNYPL